MPKHIEEEWQSYIANVYPGGHIPPVILVECEMAFYAGASGLLHQLLGSISTGDETTEADVQVVRAIRQELRNFAESVRKRRIGRPS